MRRNEERRVGGDARGALRDHPSGGLKRKESRLEERQREPKKPRNVTERPFLRPSIQEPQPRASLFLLSLSSSLVSLRFLSFFLLSLSLSLSLCPPSPSSLLSFHSSRFFGFFAPAPFFFFFFFFLFSFFFFPCWN
ncbi:hypothetical protein P170DRAFT_41710 [Aspergillus steynii IBT 23096]|uniref:Transmembrane protein n=1 Tax=Aspergillus steynii IBT 23096 TaxID=1392250 RepID=A0A2I2GRE3_9EURO|nr:uncharacterized protein P170DRAFT_41710 [Aspergillus steynii IBT 23096]PLB55460.1 hypothetical protein P170DRAFT_41710 [Aspergillus steynii IBT 23096]